MHPEWVRLQTIIRTAASWRSAIFALVIAALLVPVIVPSGFFFPYVFPRSIFFRVVVELGTLLLVWAVCFGDDDLDLRYEPIFWAVVAFVIAAALSAVFSPARDHSLFGDFERMGGVWTWLHLALFFLLLRTLRDEEWRWVLNAVLIVSLFVSAGAIVEHFQIDVVEHSADTILPASASTIGNSGLLAGYLLFALGVAVYRSAATTRFRYVYLGVGLVDLIGLLYAENRSTVIGLVLGAMTGAVLFGTLRPKRRRWIAPMVAGGIACVVVACTFALREFPSGAVARFTPTVVKRLALTSPAGPDRSRLMQWRAAVDGFEDRPLLGYGPENYNLVWSAHFNPDIYHLDTDIYDRTHNEYLEILSTGGALGALAFLSIWLAIAVTLVRAYRDDRLSPGSLSVLVGLQVAYATYLCFWFFDLNSTMLWILVGALISSRENTHGVLQPRLPRSRDSKQLQLAVASAGLLVVALMLYSEAYLPIRANRALATLDGPRGTLAETVDEFHLLATTSARESAHTPLIMSEYLDWLRPDFAQARRNPRQRREIEAVFANAFLAFRREIHRDTLNDRLYTHEASLLLDAARFYNSREYVDDAIDALHKAMELSPRRIQPRMLLATLYTEDRDFDQARAVIEDAIRTDPNLGEPRYRMAEYYLRFGKTDSAFALLATSLRQGYVGAPETYLAVGKRLEFSRRASDAAELYASYLEAKYTKAVWDGSETIDRRVPPADIALAAHLPLLYVRAQESELAIKTAAALSAFDSTRTDLVDQFVSDLGSRRRSRWVAKNSLLPCAASRTSAPTDPDKLSACGIFRKKL